MNLTIIHGLVEMVLEEREAVSVFERPAIFISSLSPGYIAGGSQCTLAFLQAVATLHNGNVIYFGPPWLIESDACSINNIQRIEIGSRPMILKTWHWVVGDSADRVSPHVDRFLKSQKDYSPIVYFNGDAIGAAVNFTYRHNMPSVFIPHNFVSEYLDSKGVPRNILEFRRNRILAKVALKGFQNASARICLTTEDCENYLDACAERPNPGSCIAPCYFSYQRSDPEDIKKKESNSCSSMILFNTNLALKANVEGIAFFINEVWPYLRSDKSIRLVLAGRAPRQDVFRFVAEYPEIELVVRPEPDAMEQLFNDATICAAIAFRGSGIKLRVAEALRRGVPVIASKHCARGYENVSDDVLKVFHNADQVLEAIHSLIKTDRSRIELKCREQHNRHFSFEVGLKKIKRLEAILS